MSIVRKLGVVVLTLLLTTTLVTTSVVTAAHLTVLDPNFVKTSIEEEGGYAMVTNATQQAAADQMPSGGTGGTGVASVIDSTAIVRAAVTDEYVASQTEANVDRLYAYLHGNRDDLNLSVSTEPIRENVSAEVERQLRNASIAELLAESNATLSGPANASVLERMTANESSYEAVKADVRAKVRAQVLDAAVDRAFTNASNDQLLALVDSDYDPTAYTAEEKETMVADRESEIRAALRTTIERRRGDEIDQEVENQLAALRNSTAAVSTDTEVGTAVAEIQSTITRGLTTDMSYQAFSSNLSAAKADLAAATANQLNQRLASEMPNRIDLTEQVAGDSAQPLKQPRMAVQWLDRLAFALPAFALVLVGLLYLVRRSPVSVASDTGVSMLLAGLPLVVGVEIARPMVQSTVASVSPDQPFVTDFVAGFVGRILATTGTVGLVVTAGGLALVGVSMAARFGLFDRFGSGPGDTSGGSEDSGASDEKETGNGQVGEASENGDGSEMSENGDGSEAGDSENSGDSEYSDEGEDSEDS